MEMIEVPAGSVGQIRLRLHHPDAPPEDHVVQFWSRTLLPLQEEQARSSGERLRTF